MANSYPSLYLSCSRRDFLSLSAVSGAALSHSPTWDPTTYTLDEIIDTIIARISTESTEDGVVVSIENNGETRDLRLPNPTIEPISNETIDAITAKA